MKKLILLAAVTGAMLIGLTSAASAACVAPYCPSPSASATGATNVGTGTATLNATINTNGGNAASWTISLTGFGTVASGSIPDGVSPVPISANVGGLTAGSTYTYTVTVTNAGGSASSSALFTTQSLPPAPPVTPSEPSTTPPPTTNPPSTSEPNTNPTTTPPTATRAERNDAADQLDRRVRNGDLTFEAQVGSALVFGVQDAKPNRKGRVQVLAMTVDPGAEVETSGSIKLENGKTIKLPKATATVRKNGELVVSVKLTRKQRKQLAKAGGGTASIKVQVTDQYGTHTETVKVDIEPNKAKKHKKHKRNKKNG
jgi:hypothetical protein